MINIGKVNSIVLNFNWIKNLHQTPFSNVFHPGPNLLIHVILAAEPIDQMLSK